MLHSVEVDVVQGPAFRAKADAADAPGRARRVSVVSEHFEVEVTEGADGQAWVRFREGAAWSRPVRMVEVVRRGSV